MKFKIVEEVIRPENFRITNYKFRPDGTLDVFQTVNLEQKNLTELPFKFGKIEGSFWCYNNKFKTLKGAPIEVEGDFDCSINYLTSLKYAPEKVGDRFNCSLNRLIDLKYSPKEVKSDFHCDNNNLTSLTGLNLDGVNGKIYLRDNPNLKLTEKEEFWRTLNPGRMILK